MPKSNFDAEKSDYRKVRRSGYTFTAGQGIVILLSLFIVVVTLSVYAQTRDFAFLNYDDPIYTTDNDVVQKGLTLSGVIWAFTEGTSHTNYWAPLTWITFLIDHELYGLDPGGYHITNVLFHVLNSLLLFIAFLHLTDNMWKSFFLAVFFALHPLHVESVAWISERKDVVSTFFWILTLIAYAHYVRKPGIANYSAVFVMFICCLMGKPMGVTLPFVLLLLDYWPLGRYGQGKPDPVNQIRRKFRRLIGEKLPLFFITAIILPLTFYSQDKAGALKTLADIPLFFRIENVIVSYASQILKTFWPVKLGILYPYPESLPLWKPVIAFLLLAAITGTALKFLLRFPYLIVGWLWFLGTFVPVAGFIVIGPHVTADRYTYIPLIGIFLMVIWGGFDLCTYLRIGKKVVILLTISMVAVCGWLTWKQIAYWENDIKIYAHTLKVTDANWPVHLNLGTVYREKNREDLALGHYQSALRIRPDIPEVQLSVGEVLAAMGRIGEVVSHYENALKIKPESAAIHSALAVALDKSGETDRAVAHFLKALEIDNDSAEAHHGLGVTLFQQGQVDLAIEHYRKAVRIDRDFSLAHNNLGVALMTKGEIKQAHARFMEAISSNSEYADPHYALGVLYLKIGDKNSAIYHFDRALQIDPTHKPAQKGLQIASGKE
jgi:tetratricopeptide (TPR) repeat protein